MTIAVLELAGLHEADVTKELKAGRRRVRRGRVPRVLVDLRRRRTLPKGAVDEIVVLHRELQAAGGRCAVVLEPALAAQISIAHPEGLLCAASRATAMRLLDRGGNRLEVRLKPGPRHTELRLVGELDIAGLAPVQTALDEATAHARAGRAITIDLAGLRFVDAAGLRAIVHAVIQSQLAGARTRVIGAQPQALRLVELLGWTDQLAGILGSDGFERSPLGWLNRPDAPEPHRRERRRAVRLPSRREAVIATDLSGRVTHWNDAARRLYGWTREEVVGRPITELTVGPEDERVAQEVMDAVRRTGTWEGEFCVRRKDGSRFRAYVRDFVVEDAEGRPAGLVGHSIEMTEDAFLVARSVSD